MENFTYISSSLLISLLFFSSTIIYANTISPLGHNPDSLKESSCQNAHLLFQELPKVRPIVVRSLGDRPQFRPLIGIKNANDFFSALKQTPSNDKISKKSLTELNSLFQAVGYSGVQDPKFTVEDVEAINFPNGISGMMGNEKHEYRFSVIAYKEPTTIAGWKIQAENGCDFYFLSPCGNAFNPFSVMCEEPNIPLTDQIKVSVQDKGAQSVAFQLSEEQLINVPIICENEGLDMDSLSLAEIMEQCESIDTQQFKVKFKIDAKGLYQFQSSLDTILATNINRQDASSLVLKKAVTSNLNWSNISFELEPVKAFVKVECEDCEREQFLRISMGSTILSPGMDMSSSSIELGRMAFIGVGYETPSIGKKCKQWTIGLDALLGSQQNKELVNNSDKPLGADPIYLGFGATLQYYLKENLQLGVGASLMNQVNTPPNALSNANWWGMNLELTHFWDKTGLMVKTGWMNERYGAYSEANISIQVGVKLKLRNEDF